MVLKLYGNITTSCERVLAVLEEKKVPYEFIRTNFAAGEHKTPQWLEKHPFGQTPYIDDDGFILYESRAIGLYIATKYKDQGTLGLVPTEPEANARSHQAIFTEVCHVNDPSGKIMWEKVVKPTFFNLQTDEAAYEEAKKMLEEKLDVYEKILANQKYIAGNTLTIADIFHLPYFKAAKLIGVDAYETRPNVKRWADELSARPAWKAVLAIPPMEPMRK